MKNVLATILVAFLLMGLVTNVYATTSQEDKIAKENWIKTIDTAPKINGNWSSIDSLGISVYNDTSVQIITNNTAPVGNGTGGHDNDTDTGNNDTDTTTNNTKFVAGTIADIDDNSGLTTQAKLMKAQGVQLIIINGDYNYKDGAHALQRILDAGFTKAQLIIAVGNHDECAAIKAFLGTGSCINDFYVGDKNIQVITMDGNESGMTCSDSQFTSVKDKLNSNEHTISIISIHEPFVTVKTNHPANGGFACYNELFKSEGVNLVLQGHNHNYQYIEIDGIVYLTAGTGTHDTGSSMYPCGSSSLPITCISGTNGFTKLDINSETKNINGTFISNSGNVVHQWSVN